MIKEENPLEELPGDDLEQRILQVVNAPDYQAKKPRTITKLIGLEQDEVVRVRRLIKKMVRDGKLTFGAKHLVLPTKPRKGETRTRAVDPLLNRRRHPNEVVGFYRKTSQPFGFVTPKGAKPGDRVADVFIPPRKSADASDGDTVLVRLSSRPDREGRRSGTVVDILERKTVRFVGTYRERGGEGFVFIDNERFEAPVLVGDASAKNGRVGDKVIVEMVRFPSGRASGEAVIVQVLGPRGTPGIDTQMIVTEFGLPGEFEHDVVAEAHRRADHFDEADHSDRTDFSTKTIVTIDPKTARDFDDAISLERLANGHWELGVHIADVSHFVRKGSVLDREAYARGNSVYLPDKVIPMLPEIISNNLASLQPHRPRYTMSVLIELTADGQYVDATWHRGVIRSAHRFNYEEIDEYLADDVPWRDRLEPDVFRLVRDMHSLAMIMRRRRMDRGSIDLILPEVEIDLDENGHVSGAHVEEYTESHQVIEEFMLAANEAVAMKLDDLNITYLRRIHEPPNEKKLHDLTEFVRHVGIVCDDLQNRFEIKRVVTLAKDMPERHAIHFAVLRSMQKAVYSPRQVGHYALASDHYLHFTSPIRRYPDLVIHRMVGDLIDGKRPMDNFDVLEKIGGHCSEMEQRAEQAERELIKLKLLNFLADKVGERLEAFVTGVEVYGLFVQGVDLPAEGLLPLDSLPPDNYVYDSLARSLIGRKRGNQFRLGDRLEVVVAMVDPDRRLLQFGFGKATRTERRSSESGTTRGATSSDTPWDDSSRAKRRKKKISASRPANRKKKSTRNKPQRKRRR
jgi:ribonuclease R